MTRRIRRGTAALGLAAALLVTVPAPSRAMERGGGNLATALLRQAASWLARLWPAPAPDASKEGSMIDPNGAVQPPSQTTPDEGSMIDPNGGR